MKLYFTPGACSLATHIALRKAELPVTLVRVDLATRQTEHGDDYTRLNPKGYVPTLVLDDGTALTESVAILDWIADYAPSLRPSGPLGRTRLIEALAFLTTEVHRPFMRMAFSPAAAEKDAARSSIADRLTWLGRTFEGPHLFGSPFSAADAYLYVMVRWARDSELPLPAVLGSYVARLGEDGAVRAALAAEGIA